jgi:UDP-N-acetylglucosamine acyltransferase
MGTLVHPQAIVSPKAHLDDDVSVGPFSFVEDNVVIGKGTTIGPGVHVCGYTTIGKNCRIVGQASIGTPPQDLKYNGQKSFLEIGDDNVIREFVTMNPGTSEGSKTVIGSGNLFMAYSHVAHDCLVGSNCVFANLATLAGHVTVEDNVVIGGLSAIHQFCRVGCYVMIGGLSRVTQDVAPYTLIAGQPVRVFGLNSVGLRRAGFSADQVARLKKAVKIALMSEHAVDTAIEIIERDVALCDHVRHFVDFIRSAKKRGLVRGESQDGD